MTFAVSQLRKLRARLNPRHVRTREAEGQNLHYLEGWHVIAEANRIFGFDGWDRTTLSSDCVWTRQQGSRYCAAYVARVRIAVRAGETTIIREGCGVGESNAASPGQAHDFAAKAAETDATKRALMTFGNAFGLSLYRGNPVSTAQTDPVATKSLPLVTQTSRSGPAIKHNGNNHLSVRSTEDGWQAHKAATAPQQESNPAIKDVFPGDREEPGFTKIDKSVLARSEPRRIRDTEHLRYVASQACLICGRTPSEAHHVRFAQPRALSRKVSDEFTVPLCALHHRDLHAHGNEEAWWTARNCDALAEAARLWTESRRMEHAPSA